jgi:Ca2+-binding EF-hand superfamily protein
MNRKVPQSRIEEPKKAFEKFDTKGVGSIR